MKYTKKILFAVSFIVFIALVYAEPSIDFVTPPTPSNASTTNDNYFIVNVSASDTATNISVFIDIDNSLLSWYRMDDLNASGGLVDYMNRYNGTVVGGAHQNDTGKLGKSFSFDGSGDYIDFGTNSYFTLYNFSWSGWLYARGTDINNYNTFQSLNCQFGGTDESGVFMRFTNINKIQIGFATGSDFEYAYTNRTFDYNQWYHIAMVKNHTTIELYVNGQLNSTSTLTTPNIDYASTMGNRTAIGAGWVISSPTSYFNGSIDDVLLFNRSLKAEEVYALYANTSSTYLYSNFKLKEGTHTYKAYAQDLAGNINSTELRQINLDGTAPSMSYVTPPTPSNASTTMNQYFTVNVSSSDANEHYIVTDFDNSLMGWWRGEDYANDTMGRYNLALVGNASNSSVGKFGKAFTFDGNGDYLYNSLIKLPATQHNLTYSAWIYCNDPGREQGIMGTGAYDGVWMAISASKLRITWPGYGALDFTDLTIPSQQWVHVVITRNETGNYSGYLNGVKSTGRAPSYSIPTYSASFAIGTIIPYTAYYFNGSIDDAMVFNRSLSQAEISSLYNATKTQFQTTYSAPVDRNYTFKSYGVDTFGNLAQLDLRQVNVDYMICDEGDYTTTCNFTTMHKIANGSTITANNVIIKNGGSLVNTTNLAQFTLTLTGDLTIQNGGNITGSVNISASNVYIQSGATISADALGYDNNTGYWGNLGTNLGGSHSNQGGLSTSSTYDSVLTPTKPGEGGYIQPAQVSYGMDGGGVVIINSQNDFALNGSISANAGARASTFGGGAGGSIYIISTNLSGNGTLNARGGVGGYGSGGPGGSGGNIAVYYNSSTFLSLNTSKVDGGAGVGQPSGLPGSLIFIDRDTPGVAQIASGFIFQGYNESVNTTFFNTNNPTFWNFTTLTVNPGTTLSLATPINWQNDIGSWKNITWKGICYSYSFNHLIMLNITLANLSIDSNSGINLKGCGYVNKSGPGAGTTGFSAAAHASFGGSNSAPAYGSALAPTTFGSGGGHNTGNLGAYGGGVVIINVQDTLDINGSISVNGTRDQGLWEGIGTGGGGSGGSIYLTTRNLKGTGSFYSIGGNGAMGGGGGGGSGGRIAVYYNTSTFTNYLASSVTFGADIGGGPGGTGTIIFVDMDDNSATLVKGFRFQNITGAANESVNTSFFNTNTPYLWNFTNLTILNAQVFENFSGQLQIQANNNLTILNSNISMSATDSINISFKDRQQFVTIQNLTSIPPVTIFLENSTYGMVKYMLSTGSFTPQVNEITFTNNTILVDSSTNPTLNQPAEIWLYSDYSRISKVVVLKNNTACYGCIQLGLTSTRAYFNVSGFTNYSVDVWTPNINFTSPSPSNGDIVLGTGIYMNVSSSDATQHYTVMNFDESLISWWRAEVGANDTMKRNNGTFGGNANANSVGKYGNAFSFDGNGDFIGGMTGTQLGFNRSLNFSVCAWAKLNVSAPSTVHTIASRINTGSSGNGWSLSIKGDLANDPFSFSVVSNGYTNDFLHFTFGSSTSLTSFHHVCVVYYQPSSVSGFSAYLDGVNQTKTIIRDTLTSDISYLGLNFQIGSTGNTLGNWFNGSIDEVMIFNRSLSSAEVLSIYNATQNQLLNNYSTTFGNHTFQAFAVDEAGTINSTEIRTITLTSPDTNPVASDIWWSTTGGFTTTDLTFLQTMDFITANGSDADAGDSINFTLLVYDGSQSLRINTTMDNVTYNTGNYTTDFVLDVLGTWNITVIPFNSKAIGTAYSETFTVSKTNQTLIDGYYGYDTESLPDNTTIQNLVPYDYNLIELTIKSNFTANNWSKTLEAINYANQQNLKVGMKYQLAYSLAFDNTSRDDFMNNITSYFPTFLTGNYLSTIAYIKIDTPDTFTDAQITQNNLNLIGRKIVNVTLNFFPVYSSYNSSTLDDDYIPYANNLVYVNGVDNASVVNRLANLTRIKTTKTRIYFNITDEQKIIGKNYYWNIIVPITSTIKNPTLISSAMVSELDNGDLIVYNNGSSILTVNYNVSNGTDIIGKDLWSYTQDILITNNSNGSVTFLDLPPYQAILVGTEDVDHIWIGSDYRTGTVSTITSNELYNSNITDGVREGASMDSTPRAMEFWSNNYQNQTVMVYYGLLSSSQIISPQKFNGLTYLIIADKTDAQIDKLFWSNITIGGVYGYISVGNYNASNSSWYSGKTAEVDAWIALNGSMNIFFDGLDSASIISLPNFESAMKNLTDYVKLTKKREVGINVFTQYQSFAQLSSTNGFAMRESCTNKWVYANGVDSSAGYNYSAQYWEDYCPGGGACYGDYNRSLWYNRHNINLVCVAFMNRNDTAHLPSSGNYSLMQKLYLKSKVLGYSNFYVATPTFNIAYNDKFYNLGSKLQSEPTRMNDLYSMRYTVGTVYYNSTSDQAWINDGLQFKNASISFLWYGDGVTHNICVNDYCGYTSTPAVDWGYQWYPIYLNKSVFDSASGHFYINFSSASGFIGDDTNLRWGYDSWYWQSGMWNVFGNGNHMVKLDINVSHTNTIDTTTKINQINATGQVSRNAVNMTLNSSYAFNTKIWSYYNNFSGVFRKINIWNNSWTQATYTNDVSCTNSEPVFSYNQINGIGLVGVCMDNSTSGEVRVRVEFPSLSTRLYQVDMDGTAPTITLQYPNNGSYYSTPKWKGYINMSINEIGGNCSLNDTKFDYFSGTLGDDYSQFSFKNNTNFDTNGDYFITAWCADQYGNNQTMVIKFSIDNLPPSIKYSANQSVYGENLSQDFVYISVDLVEANFENITYSLTDGTSTTYTYYTPQTVHYFIPLTDDTYYYNVSYVWDKAGNMNSTETRMITLDTRVPNTNLISPLNGSTQGKGVTFSVYGDEKLKTCSYSLDNFNTNTSMQKLNDTHFTASGSPSNGVHAVNFSCYDYAGNVNNTINSIFTVSYTTGTGTPAGSTGGCSGLADYYKKCYYIDASDLTCRVGCDPGYTCNSIYRCVLSDRSNETTIISYTNLTTCVQQEGLVNRLKDKCTVLDGICSDGEDPIRNKEDCPVTTSTVSCKIKDQRCIFKEIWFFKGILILLLIYLIKPFASKVKRKIK